MGQRWDEIGTRIVADLSRRLGFQFSRKSHAVERSTLFSARGTGGIELYVTDGTEAGTTVVKDIRSGSSSSSPSYLTPVGNETYFRADDDTNGAELWKTDGTEAGTVLVKNIYPGRSASFPTDLTNVDGTLFFAQTTANTVSNSGPATAPQTGPSWSRT